MNCSLPTPQRGLPWSISRPASQACTRPWADSSSADIWLMREGPKVKSARTAMAPTIVPTRPCLGIDELDHEDEQDQQLHHVERDFGHGAEIGDVDRRRGDRHHGKEEAAPDDGEIQQEPLALQQRTDQPRE